MVLAMPKEDTNVRFSIRFDLSKESHARAWNKVKNVKNGDRSEYCIRCILGSENMDDELKTVIQETIRSALADIQFMPIATAKEIKDDFEVPDEINDFMNDFNDF